MCACMYVCMYACPFLLGVCLLSTFFFQFSQGQQPGGIRFGITIVASRNVGVFSHAAAFGFWILIMVPHITGYYNPSKNFKQPEFFMALTLGFLMSGTSALT